MVPIRTVYLIRHGQPQGTDGPATCGYAGDPPLSPQGQKQGEELARWAADKELTAVFASPHLRSVETAQSIAGQAIPLHIRKDLRETDTGLWTGLTFDQIRLRWPREYQQRGHDLANTPPPDGESFAQAGRRMERCMKRIFSQSRGNIAVVSHGGILRSWLSTLTGHPLQKLMELPQPWGSITRLTITECGQLHVEDMGVRPNSCPDGEEMAVLFAKYQTPDHVIAHGQAVAAMALELAKQLSQPVELELLTSACFLHDLARTRRNHPQAAAGILIREGYPKVAELIAWHHDLPEEAAPEAELLYLADKLIKGTCRVSLEERFQTAKDRCSSPKGELARQARWQRAKKIIQDYHLQVE